MMNYEYFMKKALEQAEYALSCGEFPVGCVITYDNEILVTGFRTNSRTDSLNEIDHAEITALRQLADFKGDKSRLIIFSTMEPCLMCFSAIILSGIEKIVYAYEDVMGGGTKCDFKKLTPLYNRNISIIPNILREQSIKLFKAFFANQKNEYWKSSLLAEYTLSI